MSPAISTTLDAARLRRVTWLITGALFMEILDGAVIAPALPAMASSFGRTALELNVGISVYLLAVGIFIPASGWLAERIGARKIFMLAIALFTLSSALCAMATGLWSFVTLRALQGFSGALMVPVGRLVLLVYTPKDKLMATMSALIWPALVAPVIGPPLGGLITLHLGWHWIFLLNVPLGLLALLAAWKLVPETDAHAARPFDWRGFLLCGVGTMALLSGLERLVDRVNAAHLVLTAVGAVLLGLAWRHFGRASDPMLDLASLRVPTFRAVLRGGSLARMAIGSSPFLLTLMFQLGFGYDAFKAGAMVVVLFAGNLLMKTVTTPILRCYGYRPVLIWNGVLSAASLGACAMLEAQTPPWWVALVLLACGMTRSMQFTALGTVSFADIAQADMSHANGLSNTIGQLSMAAGITMAAMGVHLGMALASPERQHGAMPYQIAFVLLALLALASVIEMVLLPKGAGDHFIARK